MDRKLLAASKRLKSIFHPGTGASTFIGIPAAKEFGIQVLIVQNCSDRTVAEHAFAHILAAAKRIALMDRELRGGTWNTRSGVELKDKVLGVVGTGGIGAELIRIAHLFSMSIIAWNRRGVGADLPCLQVALDQLMQGSDVALNDDTPKLIDAHRLALMRPSAFLINTSRGAVVDEQALVEVLRKNKIAHAALDVFETEPLSLTHLFVELDNVTMIAHAGFKTSGASRRLLTFGFELLHQDLKTLSPGEELAAQ